MGDPSRHHAQGLQLFAPEALHLQLAAFGLVSSNRHDPGGVRCFIFHGGKYPRDENAGFIGSEEYPIRGSRPLLELQGREERLPILAVLLGEILKQGTTFHIVYPVARDPLRRRVPGQDSPFRVGGEHDVAGTVDHAGEVAFGAAHFLAQLNLFGHILHQQQDRIHVGRPDHRYHAIVVRAQGHTRCPVGKPLSLRGPASVENAANRRLQAELFEDHLRENLGQPLADDIVLAAEGLFEKVPVGEEHLQVSIDQEDRRGNRVDEEVVKFLGALASRGQFPQDVREVMERIGEDSLHRSRVGMFEKIIEAPNRDIELPLKGVIFHFSPSSPVTKL